MIKNNHKILDAMLAKPTTMKINTTQHSAQKIEAALLKVNGNAKFGTFAHTVTEFSDVTKIIDEIEYLLTETRLPKKYWKGAIVKYTGGGLKSFYKYAATSTAIQLERGSKNWFITAIDRATIYPGTKETFKFNLSDAQQNEIIKNTLATLNITPKDPTP